ncbi:Glucose 1-dehydrogenase OS=Streptomyces rimosus subsp. rimosus (strain ATCC / DSM 40260 / JCM 4667 / NRRL 2234) OX=1265868 GN=SRIM_033740 PE=4 SV=1 [Streptomyces rimosus subsp. rimosus]
MRREVPVGRWAATAEIAAAVLYLSSDEAAFTVGAELVVDGGVTA